MAASDEGLDSTERAGTLRDVRVLLEYLGQQADIRLQSHFEDTRPQLSAPIARRAAPPCRTYRYFLGRLTAIIAGQASPRVPRGEQDDLTDDAFLCYARDFLAAVAAPASVHTILATKAYAQERRYPGYSRLLHEGPRRRSPVPGPVAVKSRSRSEEALHTGARRLARRVAFYERLAIGVLLGVIGASTYAFTGQAILESQARYFGEYQSIGHDLDAYLKDARVAKIDVADAGELPPPGCDRSYDEAHRSPTVQIASASPTAAIQPRMTGVLSMNPRLCALYWRIRRNNQDITAVTLHLISWSGFVLETLHLGDLFGVSRQLIDRSATVHHDFCRYAQLPTDSDGSCTAALENIVYQATEAAQSLLNSITLYVLPTLYGFLGGAMAALRNQRRKAELYLVTLADRGRIQQDVILASLCGAIMALFAGYIGKGTAAEGLGLSALALLAGYNVPAMLSFLDGLSNRVFQPRPSSGVTPS